MRPTIAWLSLACGTAACFSPEQAGDGPSGADTTTETSAGPTTSEPTSEDPSMSSMSMTSMGDPTTASTTMTTTTSEDTSNTELGPRLVMSVPADGDLAAPLDGYFLLYFDRVVGVDDATGHIFVSQGGGEPQPIAPMPCPPDADPTCIAGIFPAEFVDPETNNLPGGTAHTILVEADFPDPDGMVNTMDQVVSFTTFEIQPDFFDDSDAIGSELGGLAYDPGSESLFVVGEDANSCLVRRIPIPGGVAGSAQTAVVPTGSVLCYGIDAIDGVLYVSGSYSDNVYRYTDLGDADLGPNGSVIANPTLMPPLSDLIETWSVARGGGSTFFSHGEFVGGIEDVSILRLTDAGMWSEFQSGENLWEDADGVVIVGGNYDGADHLVVAAQGQFFKFRISDGSLVSQVEAELGYAVDLQIDSSGRLWVGDNDGLRVLNVANDSFEVLAERSGFDATRFALREDGDTVHAYYARFRDPATIGHLAIDF